jgi:hypothetical protein
MVDPGSRTNIAIELAYDALFRRVIGTLAAAGIPVMPLKGVLFSLWLYENPADRLGGDIDLLVREDDFSKAVRTLESVGFQSSFAHPNGRECTLLAAFPRIEVDLHRGLFAVGRYRIRTDDLFARGSRNAPGFPDGVVLPDPLDAYAHVIGHSAADHLPSLPVRVREDLSRLVARFDLCPKACAERLDGHGLGRAARYVLGFVVDADSFAKTVLTELAPDPVGEVLVRIARTLTRRFAASSIGARAAGFLTTSSLFNSGFAVAVASLNRVRMSFGLEPV